MPPPADAQETMSPLVTRLLAPPSRPGQAFTLPGTNHDGVYRMACRLKAYFDAGNGDADAVVVGSEDRAIVAAALLATLAGGPTVVLPQSLFPDALEAVGQRTGATRAITDADIPLPSGMARIDLDGLTDAVESLQGGDEPDPDRAWVRFAVTGGDEGIGIWTKNPRALLTEANHIAERFGVGSDDRILASTGPREHDGLILSVLLPLLASARVASVTPVTRDAIDQQVSLASPTLFVGRPDHYRQMENRPVKCGSLRLAFCTRAPLAEAVGQAFADGAGVDLVEIYGTPATGIIATRCRAGGETAFTPFGPITCRVSGRSLDIRSPLLSPELSIRSNGWATVAEGVRAHGSDGFVPPDLPAPASLPAAPAGEKAEITVEPSGRRIPVDPTQPLQTLIARHGIDIRADCGGAGICGKCRVLVAPASHFTPPTPAELEILAPAQLADGARLACQTRANDGGSVTIPDNLAAPTEARGKTDIAGSYPVDATVRRRIIAGGRSAPGQAGVPASLLGRLAGQAGPGTSPSASVAALRQLGSYRGSLRDCTLVVHADTGISRIIDGHHPRSLGFAVDLGTTSIAGYLCDLTDGRILAAEAGVNPQRRFGEDVISRIGHINETRDGLGQLQRLVAEGINALMARCLGKIDAGTDAIDDIAICGNTTMTQIAARLDPHGLGMSPYLPVSLTLPGFSAGDLGLACDDAVPVCFMPVISGFVGGDTTAAILADRPHDRDTVTLIVDIGTNGEVVLGNRDALWVTSCATGPALEGAQISCGMRAVSGAIHRVWPDEDGTGLAYEVLGDHEEEPAQGICGSGIIDAIAAMRRIGVILPNGRLNETMAGVFCDAGGVGRRYVIQAGRNDAGGEIAVTLQDIRQIQLAKSALCVGIELLMRRAGIDRIDHTVLTGAFGARFDWRSALAIGLLPPAVARSRITARDNLAGVGVVMALLDRQRRIEAARLCRRVRSLELAAEPDFATAFAKGTVFPDMAAQGGQ